ncbi:MAG: response regulator transcription factor [Verrucomicrobiota bacterium]|jgi:DNA-binding NarL/FixJ family response regulator
MKRLRILLADDHKIIRDGLKLLVNDQPDMHVVGEAGNGREVLEKARELKPNVVVMDLSMPEMNGLQATARLKEERPEIKVVALTVHEDESYLRQLCQAGAAGYVLKRSAGDELIQAIRTVAKGGLFFDATLANKALAGQRAPSTIKGETHTAELSEREKDVLIQLAWGFSNKEIAAKLRISVKTVETYKVRIGEKLGLRSRSDIVQYAMRQGWMNETSPFTRIAR